MLKLLLVFCAITTQIFAADYFFGTYLPYEKLIKRFGYEGTYGQNIDVTRKMLHDAHVTKITRVEVIDVRPDKNGGSAFIESGGLGFPHARIKLIPLPYQVMQFHVAVYGIHVPLQK